MRFLYLVPLVLICGVINICQAQTLSGWGMFSGVTVSQQNWDYFDDGFSRDMNAHNGFNAGVFTAFALHPSVELIPRLSYTQHGSRERYHKVIISDNEQGYIDLGYHYHTVRLDYLNIELLGKYSFRNNLLPFVFAGPHMEFMVYEKNTSAIYDQFNRSNLGISTGIGWDTPLTRQALFFIEAQYSRTLNNLFENENLRITHASAELKIGVMFR